MTRQHQPDLRLAPLYYPHGDKSALSRHPLVQLAARSHERRNHFADSTLRVVLVRA